MDYRKMKLKIVTRKNNGVHTYDVYHGFGYPISNIPFFTKWMLDREGLTPEELGRYISLYMDNECRIYFPYSIWNTLKFLFT